MDVTTPSSIFHFHFLVENKENQLYFPCFSPWYHTPKKLSKTQVEKANFVRVFPGTLLQRFPWHWSRQTNPVFQPQPVKPTCQALIKGSHSALSVSEAIQSPHLKHFPIFREMEPDNVLDLLFLAVHLH